MVRCSFFPLNYIPAECVIAREPSPDADSGRIELADVGYISKGCFNLLFSAGLLLGERVRGTDVPRTFKQLNVGKIIQRTHLPAGFLCTNGVRATRVPLTPSQSPPLTSPTPTPSPPPYARSITSVTFGTSDPNSRMMESASRVSFRLTGGQGAALLTKHSTYREDIQQTGAFEKYVKEHYDSWVTFARDTGHGDVNPVIVTGIDRTKDFAMLCYSNNDPELGCKFTTSAPRAADWGTRHKTGFVHTNHGPQPRSPPSTRATLPPSSSSGNTGSISDEYNQSHPSSSTYHYHLLQAPNSQLFLNTESPPQCLIRTLSTLPSYLSMILDPSLTLIATILTIVVHQITCQSPSFILLKRWGLCGNKYPFILTSNNAAIDRKSTAIATSRSNHQLYHHQST